MSYSGASYAISSSRDTPIVPQYSNSSSTSSTAENRKQKAGRFTSTLVPEAPRKQGGIFNSLKLKNKKDLPSPRESSTAGEAASGSSTLPHALIGTTSQAPGDDAAPSPRRFSFLDHFRPRAKSDTRKKFSVQRVPEESKSLQVPGGVGQISGARQRLYGGTTAEEKRKMKMASDMLSVYATIHGSHRPHMATIPSVEEETRMDLDLDMQQVPPASLPALFIDTILANIRPKNRRAESKGQSLSARLAVDHRKRSLSGCADSAVDEFGYDHHSRDLTHKSSLPYARSTSAKASSYHAQRSLDSTNLEEKSPKHVMLFKESALASGVELMQAITLENKELLFFHLLKVNKSFNILPNSSKVVVFDVGLSVKKAFYALVYNSVRAATLINSEQQYVGMLTITDFIQILQHHEKHGTDYVTELEHNTIADWKKAQAEEHRLKPFLFLYSEQSLYRAVEILLEHRVHRLPIIDKKTYNIMYILTLKRLLKYLHLYTMDMRPSFLFKTPKELGIGTYENLVSVTHETPLREALHKFVGSRVSSLPVLDSRGAVVDVYCKFDVVNLLANNSYTNLDISLREALRQRRASQMREDMRHRSNFFEDVIKCSPTDNLWQIIETLVEYQIHRVIIADDSQKLTGLVSLSDIFQFLIVSPVLPVIDPEASSVLPVVDPEAESMSRSTSCNAYIGTL